MTVASDKMTWQNFGTNDAVDSLVKEDLFIFDYIPSKDKKINMVAKITATIPDLALQARSKNREAIEQIMDKILYFFLTK